MYIEKIVLNNFRNYLKQEIILEKGINIFYGKNAQGKTNILESIFICSLGKSFRTKKDNELIKFNEQNAKIEVDYQKEDRKGNIVVNISEKKLFYLNKIKIKKTSELLGKINIVIFTPEDINIIKGTPKDRRRFLDMMIGQLRPKYVFALNQYLKIIEQRNNYLKQIKFENKNEELLDIWDLQLIEYNEIIYNYRNEFINKIKNKINNIHKEITNNKETIDIKYNSIFINKELLKQELKNKRKEDIKKGFTSIGIHKDDFLVNINNKNIIVYGSQGQCRTVILTLKLTELKIIYDEINEYPILLLDDFMSELDKERQELFLKKIENNQVIITCTELININNKKTKNYKIENGKIV